MKGPTSRQVTVAAAVLFLIGFALCATGLILLSRSVSGVKGDFCTYTLAHYKATLELPRVPARVAAAQSDLILLRQLGCPGR